MSVCGVSWLEPPRTVLANLDVVEPLSTGFRDTNSTSQRRARLLAGDLIVRCDLDTVDGDLQAAAELLVGLLERTHRHAA